MVKEKKYLKQYKWKKIPQLIKKNIFPLFLYQLQEFIQGKLVPQFDDVTTAASNLRNSISKEVKQMGMVSLFSLDRRTLEG